MLPSTSAATRRIRPAREGDAKVSQAAWATAMALGSLVLFDHIKGPEYYRELFGIVHSIYN